MIPGNPYAEALAKARASHDGSAIASAVLALAYEQHQRNRLAATTAKNRGITLPDDLAPLAWKD